MLENAYQAKLIKKIKTEIPGCMILKNDSSYIQGIPDLTVFYKNKWCVLEVKKSANEKHQPNQDYYVDKMNRMSFAAFIFPENQDEVIEELKKYFYK